MSTPVTAERLRVRLDIAYDGTHFRLPLRIPAQPAEPAEIAPEAGRADDHDAHESVDSGLRLAQGQE